MSSTLYLKQSGRLSENRTHKPGFVNIRKSMTTRLLLTLMLFVRGSSGASGYPPPTNEREPQIRRDDATLMQIERPSSG